VSDQAENPQGPTPAGAFEINPTFQQAKRLIQAAAMTMKQTEELIEKSKQVMATAKK
jgi:hypothetical protein